MERIRIKLCNKCNKNPRHSTLYMCRECRFEYNIKNKLKIVKYSKNRYESDKPRFQAQIKEYAKKNPHVLKKNMRDWYKNNREKVNTNNRNRYNNDLEFKIKLILRNSLNLNIKAYQGNKYISSLKLVGCEIDVLIKHIESQFKPEMIWGNHGKLWEIDHIKPCALFDLTDPDQQKQCFHYTNLQPLFKTTEIAEKHGYNEIGNRNKGKKII